MTTSDKQKIHNAQRAAPMAEPLDSAATQKVAQDAGTSGIKAEKAAADAGLAAESMGLLAEHKGKLAIGVAATLGLMVFYSWREKRLAKTAPDEYARLQRLKAVMHRSDDRALPKAARKAAAASSADKNTMPGKDPAMGADSL